MVISERDVLIRAGKTFVQSAAPTGVYLYEHAGKGAIAWPTVEAGLLGAAAAALSVIWNSSSAFLSTRREARLVELQRVIDAAVAAAKSGPTLLGPGGLVEPEAVVIHPSDIPASFPGTPLPPPPAT